MVNRVLFGTLALGLILAWIPHGLSDPPGHGWGLSKVSTCHDPGFFVNPHDCTRFFRCVDHSSEDGPLLLRYDFDCPHGTVFDQGAKVCVHARDGGCGGVFIHHEHGWSGPPKGWSPPITIVEKKGWTPPPPKAAWTAPPPAKSGWTPPQRFAWVPERRVTLKGWRPTRVQLVHSDDEDYEDDGYAWGWGQSSSSNTHWSFSPSSSYVVVYDKRGEDRKRGTELP